MRAWQKGISGWTTSWMILGDEMVEDCKAEIR
jgi:hypothetical protein